MPGGGSSSTTMATFETAVRKSSGSESSASSTRSSNWPSTGRSLAACRQLDGPPEVGKGRVADELAALDMAIDLRALHHVALPVVRAQTFLSGLLVDPPPIALPPP